MTALGIKCSFQLRQLRHIRRSLDDDSVVTLVHAFVVSRVDYCLGLLAGAPTSCNVSSTQPLESCRTAASMTIDRGLAHFRRHWLDVAYDSNCASRCSNVSIAQHGSWIPGGALLTCVQHQQTPASNKSVRRGQLDAPRLSYRIVSYTEDARSVMLDRLLGTLFLSVSTTTLHCLCLTLGTSSNTSTSR